MVKKRQKKTGPGPSDRPRIKKMMTFKKRLVLAPEGRLNTKLKAPTFETAVPTQARALIRQNLSFFLFSSMPFSSNISLRSEEASRLKPLVFFPFLPKKDAKRRREEEKKGRRRKEEGKKRKRRRKEEEEKREIREE